MVNDAISDLGTNVQASAGAEEIVPCLGSGNTTPGMICYIDTNGKSQPVDGNSATAGIQFNGIQARDNAIALDTAITDELVCNLLVPHSGRIYRVFIEDVGGAALAGSPMTWGLTTPGSLKIVETSGSNGILARTLDIVTTVDVPEEPIVAYLHKPVASGDLVAWIRWA